MPVLELDLVSKPGVAGHEVGSIVTTKTGDRHLVAQHVDEINGNDGRPLTDSPPR